MQGFYIDDHDLSSLEAMNYVTHNMMEMIEREARDVEDSTDFLFKEIESEYTWVIGSKIADAIFPTHPTRIFDFDVVYKQNYIFDANSINFLRKSYKSRYSYIDTDIAYKIKESNHKAIMEKQLFQLPITNYNEIYIKKEDKKMNIKLYECGTFIGGVVTKPQDLIKNVIFSGPCTIVQWSDGDKTIVRCENEDFEKEKGLAMAIVKKLFGTNKSKSKSNYNDIFKKWIPEEDEVPEFLNKKMNISEDKKYHTVKDTVYMSVKQYANMTGMSKSTIIRQINSGKIFGAKKDESGKWNIPVGEV